MRIFKYIILLLLLFLIGLTVFIATQRPHYDVCISKIIKNPKKTTFTFVNDYRNWETFMQWSSDENTLTYTFPENTSGVGASCSWSSPNEKGHLKTLFVKENDSIAQWFLKNDKVSTLSWKFKDTIGGTKVTCCSKGTLDFKSKVKAFFEGGVSQTIRNAFEKSLDQLNTVLDHEINTYKIKVNGVVTRPETRYIKQFTSCSQKNIDHYVKIMVPRMEHFFTKNSIRKSGPLFIMYHKYDRQQDAINLSVCMPIRDSIYINSGSDMESGSLPRNTYLKTTLTGDYSHTQQAWKRALNYISQNHYQRISDSPILEVYLKGRKDIKQPSKWITEIYIPVYPKATRILVKKTVDSTAVSGTISNEIP
ncbi:GyrI-like domain-containing protein [Flavobacterium aciduliphilum]|uniref:GyrI-like small molecule binding protein n=1 Tax=Flavobacterium aciduliphilum TaxID=1101402 RepID=A0A328YC18_9FLAO|nr:GyrI-like domain-containing protein [Flavobacterium aciduliphilum]RAR70075.1 GyrI-like small molecule binding protein [Flavobacterium aciduliphilum]